MQVGIFHEYNGHTGSIELNLNDKEMYRGKLLNIPHLITYQAQTFEELYEEYKWAVNDYVNMMEGIS